MAKRKAQPRETFVCPNCGAEVAVDAKCCPECGADEQVGWSDPADDLDLPEPRDDEETGKPGRRGKGSIIWSIAVAAAAILMALLFLRGNF